MWGMYGDQCLSKATIRRWHNAFHEGQKSVELVPHTKQPRMVGTDINVNTVAALTENNPHISTHQLSANLNISQTTSVRIMKELGMCRLVEVFGEWLRMMDSDSDLMMKIVTEDKTWMHNFNPRLKQESATWKLSSQVQKKKVSSILPWKRHSWHFSIVGACCT